jgi:hypothetical protein
MYEDYTYQDVVDKLQDELLNLDAEALRELGEYSVRVIAGIEVSLWHHLIDEDESHILLQAQRRVWFFSWRNYAAGILISNADQVEKMPNEKLSHYL